MPAEPTCPCCEGRLSPQNPPEPFFTIATTTPGPRADAWRHGLEAGWSGRFDLLQCDACGFAQVAPPPTETALRRFYASYHRNDGYVAKAAKKVRRARRRIASFANRAPGGRFLDVGCNAGFAVEAARQMGFQAVGIDVDVDAISTACKLFPEAHFRTGTVDALRQEGERYDAIFCADVIEHVTDPLAFVRALHDITAPDAVLYIATPDAGHWRTPKHLWAWEEVRPPEHLCWFTKQELAKLLMSAGFTRPRAALRLKPGLRMTAKA